LDRAADPRWCFPRAYVCLDAQTDLLDRNVNESRHQEKWILWLMVGVLLLSTALIWHDLGAREVLGRDENATITKLDQPNLKATLVATSIKVTGQPGNMQPLYFLLQYLFWPLVRRSAFMLRYLPSAFGLLGVVLTYKLGEALVNREVGLVGALLSALLPLHVRYAQIARPYSLLALLSLASACFLVRGLTTSRPLHWVGFVLTAVLNFYTHYNSLFVLAAEGLCAGIIWLATVVVVWKKRQPAHLLVGPVVGFVTVGILCMPGLLRLLRLPWVELGTGIEPGTGVMVELTVPFFRHFMYMTGLKTIQVQNLFFGLVLLGLLAVLYRRGWQAALFAVVWLAVPFVALALMPVPRPFEERYVIFVMPVALLLIAQGVVTVGEVLGHLVRRWNIRGAPWAVTAALSIGLALLLLAPLREYYGNNRSADRLDQTLIVVERHARSGDVIVISPRFFLRPLSVEGVDALYLTEHLSPAELNNLASSYQRIWLLCSSYLPPIELQEPADQWLQSHLDQLVRVPIKAINTLAFGSVASTDAEANLQHRIPVLEDLAQRSAGKYEAWLRHDLLADAYLALGELHASHGEPALAEEYKNRAEEVRAAAPPP
jgi:hypothetical protein